MSAAVNITSEGGAKTSNIFWQVAGEVIFGTTSHFKSTTFCSLSLVSCQVLKTVKSFRTPASQSYMRRAGDSEP